MNNNMLGMAFLVVGLLLIIYGFMSAESLSSDISSFFTGSPTKKSIWLLALGLVLLFLGAGNVIRKNNS